MEQYLEEQGLPYTVFQPLYICEPPPLGLHCAGPAVSRAAPSLHWAALGLAALGLHCRESAAGSGRWRILQWGDSIVAAASGAACSRPREHASARLPTPSYLLCLLCPAMCRWAPHRQGQLRVVCRPHPEVRTRVRGAGGVRCAVLRRAALRWVLVQALQAGAAPLAISGSVHWQSRVRSNQLTYNPPRSELPLLPPLCLAGGAQGPPRAHPRPGGAAHQPEPCGGPGRYDGSRARQPGGSAAALQPLQVRARAWVLPAFLAPRGLLLLLGAGWAAAAGGLAAQWGARWGGMSKGFGELLLPKGASAQPDDAVPLPSALRSDRCITLDGELSRRRLPPASLPAYLP